MEWNLACLLYPDNSCGPILGHTILLFLIELFSLFIIFKTKCTRKYLRDLYHNETGRFSYQLNLSLFHMSLETGNIVSALGTRTLFLKLLFLNSVLLMVPHEGRSIIFVRVCTL